MTDYKKLCAELLLFAEEAGEICTCEGQWPVKCDPNYVLLDRARAALAEFEPEEAQRDEAVEATAKLIYEAMRFDRLDLTPPWTDRGNSDAQCVARETAGAVLARWGRPAPAHAEPEGPTVMEIIELADEIEAAELGQVDLVRAALTRWGRAALAPAEGEVG